MNPIKSWKIIGAGTALAALGIAGIGLSGASENVDLPNDINLRDRVPVMEAADDVPPAEFRIVPAPLAEDSLDSPFDSAPSATFDSVDTASFDSPASVQSATFDSGPDTVSMDSPASLDSPDGVTQQAAPQIDNDSYDSPQTATFDSVDTASFDSPDSSS